MSDTVKLAEDPAAGEWHLDKRVPLALILAIATQTAVFAASYGAMLARVDALERTVIVNAADRERLVRVEAMVESIDARLARAEDRR